MTSIKLSMTLHFIDAALMKVRNAFVDESDDTLLLDCSFSRLLLKIFVVGLGSFFF